MKNRKILNSCQQKITVSILILMVFAFSVFLFSGCSKSEPAKLVISEKSWYYGEVTPDERPEHTFQLMNEGGELLTIESFYSSCPCILFELSRKEIPAGETADLHTIFDPTGYEGEVTKIITIKSDDAQNPEQQIETTITVLNVPSPQISLSRNTFDLGTVSREEGSLFSLTMTNQGDAELTIEDIILEELFDLNVEIPITIPPGDQLELEISLNQTTLSELEKGEFRKSIRIMTNDPKNQAAFLRIQGIIED